MYTNSGLCRTVSSVQFSCSVMSDSLQPHGLQLPCPSPTPRTCSNSCALSQWCHSTISSCVVPFSSCLQSFPASGSFPMRQFFESGSQNIGVSASASVLPVNIQDWFPLEKLFQKVAEGGGFPTHSVRPASPWYQSQTEISLTHTHTHARTFTGQYHWWTHYKTSQVGMHNFEGTSPLCPSCLAKQ